MDSKDLRSVILQTLGDGFRNHLHERGGGFFHSRASRGEYALVIILIAALWDPNQSPCQPGL